MKLYNQYKKDIEWNNTFYGGGSDDEHQKKENELIKQSYLNVIDIMIEFAEEKNHKDGTPLLSLGYNLAHNDTILYLKEQRNLIEDYE